MSTPIRKNLVATSELQAHVQAGLGAIDSADKQLFSAPVKAHFKDSLNIDEHLKKGHENIHRWDYLLGHGPSNEVIAIEPHSAKDDEASTVIAKRKEALRQLRPHLRPGAMVTRWLWVASGRVWFADTEKISLRLAQNGIQFVGREVLARHLPAKQGKRVNRRR